MQYRKKPVVIDAVRYDGWNMLELVPFVGTSLRFSRQPEQPVFIDTLEGTMRADVGDWIIKGIARECYPCKPDIFEATYEAVEPAEVSA